MMIRILLFVLSCFAVPALTAQTDHKPLAPVDGIHSLTYSISLNGNQLGARVRTVKNVDTYGDTTVVELECSDTMSPVSGNKTVHESIVATNDTTFYLIKVPNEFYDLMEKSGAEMMLKSATGLRTTSSMCRQPSGVMLFPSPLKAHGVL